MLGGGVKQEGGWHRVPPRVAPSSLTAFSYFVYQALSYLVYQALRYLVYQAFSYLVYQALS